MRKQLLIMNVNQGFSEWLAYADKNYNLRPSELNALIFGMLDKVAKEVMQEWRDNNAADFES